MLSHGFSLETPQDLSPWFFWGHAEVQKGRANRPKHRDWWCHLPRQEGMSVCQEGCYHQGCDSEKNCIPNRGWIHFCTGPCCQGILKRQWKSLWADYSCLICMEQQNYFMHSAWGPINSITIHNLHFKRKKHQNFHQVTCIFLLWPRIQLHK